MKELQTKQNFKKSLYSLPMLIIMLILTFLISRGAMLIMSKNYESAETLKELGREVETLSNRRIELDGGIQRLQTEEGLTEEIRSKYNAVRMGEGVVIVVDYESTSTVESDEPRAWYERFLDAIMDRL
jgi:cell division protein FtsB